MSLNIRAMHEDDWESVRNIYQEGLDTGLATFETQAPTWAAWDDSHLRVPRLVAQGDADEILAWAALSAVSDREVYQGVAELSIYVAEAARGQGIGKTLMLQLIESSEAKGFWTLQARILAHNTVSVKLHESCGFRIVGIRERLAKLHGTWHDVALLERRSTVTGVD